MRGIDENRMLNRGLATTLAVLAACVGAGHSVHAEWTPPEELADWDRKIAQADPEEAMALRRKRIVWRERILNPIRPGRVALDHQKMCCWFISVQIERLPPALDVAFGLPGGTSNHSRLGSVLD